ncbi:hypothetical protein [Paenibacillus chitinolyticus]|uniref:DNA-binding protein n=1 Tax=Paenibacillus chitinolyticus TaxID=79263 RepID=A0ABT4FLC3_9BACL|nr:hypothetical protein [Paenibacillus chitinolyticus]MCY9588444.1 hypothetical protein [Paenibacillus chitinolyticus]MCY9597814.1 hypothetical protein [Paenibacillus chitinolyticus]
MNRSELARTSPNRVNTVRRGHCTVPVLGKSMTFGRRRTRYRTLDADLRQRGAQPAGPGKAMAAHG